MGSNPSTQLEPEPIEMGEQGSGGEIERMIEQIGAQYIADLRMLAEEFARSYQAQLTAKDQQIVELDRRLETAVQERDALAARVQELTSLGARYVNNLRVLSEELSRHVAIADSSSDSFPDRSSGEA